MSSLVKNGLILTALLAIGWFGYYMFVLQSDVNVSLEGPGANSARLASEQFLHELNEIKNFDLTTRFFEDARFRSFVNFTEPIKPQPVGRENPFAPLE